MFFCESWRYPGPGIRAWNSRSEWLAERSGRASTSPGRAMETGGKGKLAGKPLHSAKERNDRHALLLPGNHRALRCQNDGKLQAGGPPDN